MPVIAPANFRAFVREFANATRPGSPLGVAVMAGVKAALQDRLKLQFEEGKGPDDEYHKPRRNGGKALVSNKLGNAARARVSGFGIYVEPKTPHTGDILDTQQDGYKFAERHGKVYQYRDRNNKLISYKKFVRRVRDTASASVGSGDNFERTYFGKTKKGRQTLRASRRSIGGVKFGPRILPSRPIRPVGTLTNPWIEAMGRGVEAGIARRVGKYEAK